MLLEAKSFQSLNIILPISNINRNKLRTKALFSSSEKMVGNKP